MGWARAGWDPTGVDIVAQPHYPFAFIRADALTVDPAGFDAIHASPPCQRYIRSGFTDRARHPDLLSPTRELLERSGIPWVIENVPGAPMRVDVMLCGSMFALKVRRHRWFESSEALAPWTPPCRHDLPIPGDLASWSDAMGIDWMTREELAQAIPPSYTEWIGARMIEALDRVKVDIRSGLRRGTA
jgi:DNA (cytosine-5)-methyltransferase 1